MLNGIFEFCRGNRPGLRRKGPFLLLAYHLVCSIVFWYRSSTSSNASSFGAKVYLLHSGIDKINDKCGLTNRRQLAL